MPESTDIDASNVTDSQAAAAAQLLIALDKLNCAYVLTEKFQGLVVMHGLAADAGDWEGTQSAISDLEHFIANPNRDD